MTPRQRDLARHALGLPNKRRCSYRNRFFAWPDTPAFEQWQALCATGLARHYPAEDHCGDMFALTEKGAREALAQGESLCAEDFPEVQG